MKSITNQQLAYVLLRITMGINFFGHGAIRMPKIPKFREGMLGMFKDSVLPDSLVYGFGTVLPVAEFVIGALIILGLYTRQALTAGAIVMIILIFGSCMIERFDNAGGQMLYAFMYFFLLFYLEYNHFSLDRRLLKIKRINNIGN